MNKRKLAANILVGLVVLLVVIQFIPVDRTNPPVETTISAPPEVLSILRRSCFDCHSNETVWPWYSKVAPISFLVAHDVIDGREDLNFSTWQRYDEALQKKKLAKSWEEVEEGEMPPIQYMPMHREAKLSANDKTILFNWIRSINPSAGQESNE